MRILHLGKYLAPHPGGIERFLAELMPAQRRGGHRTAALVHDESRGQARAGPRLQDRSVVVRAQVWTTLAYTPVSPGWPVRLHDLIQRWRPDVLHLHLPNPSAFWALALPSARAIPWVVHWHADVPADAIDLRLRLLYRGYRPLESAVLRRASRIIATSDAYAGSSDPLRPWQAKVSVVPLGLADRPRAIPDRSLWPDGSGQRLLFVGRFSYYKGIAHLLQAMTRLPRDTTLLLVGDGDGRADCERTARSAGLADRVRFAGALDDARLDQAYAAADLLCLPSIERSEAFGMVLLEAMRAGVPAVATSVSGSGMASVLGDEVAGIVVPPADAAALAQAVERLRIEPGLAARLGTDGRRRFVEQFQIDRVATVINSVYGLLRRIR
jgi:glycosyltransferase involved in cell wall biosynthesis